MVESYFPVVIHLRLIVAYVVEDVSDLGTWIDKVGFDDGVVANHVDEFLRTMADDDTTGQHGFPIADGEGIDIAIHAGISHTEGKGDDDFGICHFGSEGFPVVEHAQWSILGIVGVIDEVAVVFESSIHEFLVEILVLLPHLIHVDASFGQGFSFLVIGGINSFGYVNKLHFGQTLGESFHHVGGCDETDSAFEQTKVALQFVPCGWPTVPKHGDDFALEGVRERGFEQMCSSGTNDVSAILLATGETEQCKDFHEVTEQTVFLPFAGCYGVSTVCHPCLAKTLHIDLVGGRCARYVDQEDFFFHHVVGKIKMS